MESIQFSFQRHICRMLMAFDRGNLRQYLDEIPVADAEHLWLALLRAGWWFPEFWEPDSGTGKERLRWWIDQVYLVCRYQEPIVEETIERRLRFARYRLTTMERFFQGFGWSESKYEVAGKIFGLISNLKNGGTTDFWNNHFRRVPVELSFPPGFADQGNNEVYTEFCLQYDALMIDKTLSFVVHKWGGSFTCFPVFADAGLHKKNSLEIVIQWLEAWHENLIHMNCVFTNGDYLPRGWESYDDGSWPNKLISNSDTLRIWLSEFDYSIKKENSFRLIHDKSISDLTIVLRNSRRALRAWNVPIPAGFNDRPADIYEAERQLELLIDSLTPPALGTVQQKQTEVAAEQITIIEQVPTLSEKQYLILEWMLSNGSISSENRTNNKEISLGVDGNPASEQAFKVPLAELRKTHQLIDSKTGRGGGCWLTPKGIAIAKILFANREASKKQ